MKLAVTAYEAEQLATARILLEELNANLAKRGVEVTFSLTTGTPSAITVCACEGDSGSRRFPPSVWRR